VGDRGAGRYPLSGPQATEVLHDTNLVGFGSPLYFTLGAQHALAGTIQSRDKTPKTYTLTVEFLAKSGNVIST
jgi:hypothetical protein